MSTSNKQYWSRAIIHIDMNAFFASIEQLDHPELRNRPLGVTNGKAGTCFITCSYEARQYGIKTGMRFKQAQRLCPDVIRVAARPRRYVEISRRIMQAMHQFTPDVEVFSVDECFLDVTHCQRLLGLPQDIGRQVKAKVHEVSGLPCSVGVSGDKTTAKFAANLQKPDGFTVIPPWSAREVLKNVPVTALCGIGPGIGRFLAERGVHCCGDMQHLPIGVLAQHFGNAGRRIWYMAQGLDPAKLETEIPAPKTIGHGKLMPPDCKDIDTLYTYLHHMSEKVAARLRAHHLQAQHFFIGLLTERGWLSSPRSSCEIPTDDGRQIMQLCKYLLYRQWRGEGVFQCQVTALDPHTGYQQGDLFAQPDAKRDATNHVMDRINHKFGQYALCPAPLLQHAAMSDVIAPAWRPSAHRQTIAGL